MTLATAHTTRAALRREGLVVASRYTWERAADGVHRHLSRLSS
jgi:hypothetical protein